MLDSILAGLISWIEGVITHLGPAGISILMAIESCNIPLPSEAVLPFAGYLVSKGEMGFHAAAFAGAIGCVLGSLPSYYLGYFGADKWVDKYGDWAFFLCRMLPVIRTFISLPAGILKARKRAFFSLTFLGSLIWSYVLVYVGVKLGEHIDKLKSIWHKFDAVIIIAVVILGGIYIYKHVKHLKES